MRRLVGGLGAVVALMTVLSYPVGYGIMGYWKSVTLLSYKADLAAARASGFILEYGLEFAGSWRNHADQLSRAIDIRAPHSPALRQRVIEPDGAVVADKGDALAAPTYARDAPIMVGGVEVGRVVVVSSLRPLLIEVGLIALLSLTLGIAAFFVFAVLPLKVLDHTLASLETANGRFRQQNLLLDTALANMFQGLGMFDAAERLVIANGRFAEMYGLQPDDVKPGTPLHRVIDARIATGAHPGETAEGQLRIVRQHLARGKVSHLAERLGDGRAILVSIRPMAEGGWVTTHQDVTERENLNAELAQQNELLQRREDQLEAQNQLLDAAAQDTYRSWSIVDAALNNMPQGLAMFDADRRLIVCNRVYHEMYGMTAEEVKPGTTSHEVVVLRVAKGLYGDVDGRTFIDDWLAGDEASARVQQLADGRIVSVRRHRISDGRFLATHEDITERERLNLQLAQQHELLKQRRTSSSGTTSSSTPP
jgi:PAS domain-containing protein